uniref:PHD finger protein 14 n=1 Tax=Elaeophora elaphi TaxID=1147741 RepID=A0A0R3RPI7_9BILA
MGYGLAVDYSAVSFEMKNYDKYNQALLTVPGLLHSLLFLNNPSLHLFLASRAPGKRQIKPNANILLDAIPLTDSDEDDDFIIGKTCDESSSNSDLSSNDGDEEKEDENDGDAQTSDSSKSDCGLEKNEDAKPEFDVTAANGYNIQPGQLICTLCLNQRAVVRNDEVIQCDKCGVAVHENCYITENIGDSESDGSSSSTEPWFCEACLYGLKEPPYCELCPNRFGAFKKADIGGGWVHLLCALYTPGITFGDVERLSAISWQEQDYKLFGKRACIACSDPLLARTGIAVPCDAALCKNHLHVTCAQRLGLLIDNTEKSVDPNLSNSTITNSNNLTAYDVETVDPLYLTCKRHANENLMKQRKAVCELVYKQEEARMLGIRRRVLNEREERKRIQMLERHKKAMKDLEGITIAWPEHDNKRPRLFHTSAQYLELFSEKAKSNGISRQKFLENFIKVDGAQLPYLPPGFSSEFIEYFNHRKNVIPRETEKLEKLKRENEKLRNEQKKLQELLQNPVISCFDDTKVLQEWYETLHALGLRKLEKPSPPVENKARKNSPRKSQSLLAAKGPSTSKASTSARVSGKKNSLDSVAFEEIELKINFCDECKKTTEQHLMAQCDKCHKYYHLACLEPPLLKMPKKTSTQGWMCSLCCDVSSDSDAEMAKISCVGPRKLRDRSLVSGKRKEIEKAEFKMAIFSAKQHGTDDKYPDKAAPFTSPDETKKTTISSSANHSTSTAVTRKRRISDHPKKNSFGDFNGIHQHNNSVAKRVPSLSPVPIRKLKRRRSVNSLPPTLSKFKSNDTAHLNEVAQS